MANAAKLPSKLKVLYGEGDEEVLTSQTPILQQAGHEVQTAIGRSGVQEMLRKATFDLVVIGPTLTKNDRHHLPYMVKKANSATRVLVMHTDGERHPYVDGNIDTGRSMADLVAKIAALRSPASQAQIAKGAAAGK